MDRTAPGKNFLIIAGTLYIIFAVFNISWSMIGFATADYWNEVMPMANMSWRTYYIITPLYSLYTLFMGIAAVKYCNVPEKVGFLLSLLIAGFVIFVAYMILIGFAAYSGLGMFWMLPIEFVVPVLYLIGVLKNRAVRDLY